MSRIFVLLITLVISGNPFSAPKDTIPPTVKWVSPADFSVITTNTLRLAVDATDNAGGSGIAKVIFTAWHSGRTTKKDLLLKITEISSPPYETTLECYDLPDFDNVGKLVLSCEALDKAGKSSGLVSIRNFVIDRNPDFKTITIHSAKTSKKIKIDGFLGERKTSDSLTFMNNDNKIMVYTLWDKKYLYLGIKVFDQSIISHFGREDSVGTKEGHSLWFEDEVEIFFDPHHTHKEFRDSSHVQFLFSPRGYLTRVYFSPNTAQGSAPCPSIEWQTRVQGTMNQDQDQDTGYTIECRIPWKVLNIKPVAEQTLGFEVWNSDKDYLSGDYFYSSWSGVGTTNLWNPSEWGNLKLVGSSNKNIWLGVILGVAVLAVAGYGYFSLKRKKQISPKGDNFLQAVQAEAIPLDGEGLIYKEALDFIHEHYKENISLEDVVKAVKSNVSSFSVLFKEKTGMTFVQYLTEFRIERAKYLLENSKLTVTEIAEQTGFVNASYFGTVFRKKEGISPLQYRKT